MYNLGEQDPTSNGILESSLSNYMRVARQSAAASLVSPRPALGHRFRDRASAIVDLTKQRPHL